MEWIDKYFQDKEGLKFKQTWILIVFSKEKENGKGLETHDLTWSCKKYRQVFGFRLLQEGNIIPEWNKVGVILEVIPYHKNVTSSWLESNK